MADYYPLISRAVAGLEKNNGENRRVLYERARAALLDQLRGVTPALTESDITRERLALEESIRKVEAESARQFAEPSRKPPAPKIRPVEPRRTDESQAAKGRTPERPSEDGEESTPSRRYVNPPSQANQDGRQDSLRRPRAVASPSLPDQRSSDSIFDQPLPSDGPAQKRHSLRRPGGDRAATAEKPVRDTDAAVAASAPLLDRPQRNYDRPLDRPEPRVLDPSPERSYETRAEPRPNQDFSEPMLESAFAVDEDRPSFLRGPRTPDSEDETEFEGDDRRLQRSYRDLYKGLIAAVIIICVGGVLLWQWPNLVSVYRGLRSPAPEVARGTPSPATPKKTQERIEPGGSTTTALPSAPSVQQPATVAQKVVLYEEDPGDPNGKRFVGSAIWRTETVTPGPGQPPEVAIRADVEVPERKLAMTWSLRRNTDKGLPASHTVEIMFKLPTDFPSGGISNVPGILMKQAEQTRGVPLAGLAVKVTNGFYLIGLSNVETDRDRNLQLLKERGWFDIPVVYNNNRRAILAMEKGTPGDRVFADAFKAWKQ
jgi:hypothetical protein